MGAFQLLVRLAAVGTFARLSWWGVGSLSRPGPSSSTVAFAAPLLPTAVPPHECEELVPVHVVEAFLFLLLRLLGEILALLLDFV